MSNDPLLSLLPELSRRIEAWTGLFFPADRWVDLLRKLEVAAPAFGCPNAAACVRLFATTSVSKEQIDLLATYLTVGETYFFREPRSFETLAQEILPELVQERRREGSRQLRLWSAACCTGEEPYSIAMLLHRLLPDLAAWRTSILATDISQRFLCKAVEGIYGRWSFRNSPSAMPTPYFHQTPSGHYAISPALKKMVCFARLNLVEDVYPSPTNNTAAMDIVFCRNVLIYFTAQRIRRILTQLHHSLHEGGWLIVSPVETAFVMDSPFTAVQFPGVTLFRKNAARRKAFFALYAGSPLPSSEPQAEELPLGASKDLQTRASAASATFAQVALEQEERTLAASVSSTGDDNGWRRLYEEACACYAQGQYAAVVDTLRTIQWEGQGRLFSSNPPREQIMALLARAHANQGQLTEAHAWCERALAVNKFDSGLYYLYATILLECEREPEARTALTQAVYLNQRFILAHFTLGALARKRREFSEAEKHFEKALIFLQRYRSEDLLPESEGMTAGRLAQVVTDMRLKG